MFYARLAVKPKYSNVKEATIKNLPQVHLISAGHYCIVDFDVFS
jgi:hypothetical protein